MRVIFLILIGFSSFLSADLIRSGGVVRDDFTKLEWQDTYLSGIKKATWSEALIYCDELTLGEKSDWRLPNINELKSIIDRGRYRPAINSIFINVTSDFYWSSTTVASDSRYARLVNFSGGNDFWYAKTDENVVRCVRGQ